MRVSPAERTRVVPLGAVASVTRRVADPTATVGAAYVGLEHITADGLFAGVSAARPGEIASIKFRFSSRHILFGKLRPYLRKVARPAFDGVCSTDILPMLPGPEVDRDFLFHWLRSPSVTLLATQRTSGANLPRLSPSELLRFPIVLPPLREQSRIAAILDKADAIRRKRQQAIQLTDDLVHSAFLDMFGHPLRNPKNWGLDRLGNRLSFMTSGSRGWAEYYSDSGRPFLRIQNVGHNRLLLDDVAYVHAPEGAESQRTLAQSGDVLLSITADLGRTAVIPADLGPAHINQHLALLRPSNLEPLYLAAFLASEAGQAQVLRRNRQGVKAGLNFDDIRSISIPIPPAEQQRSFSELHRRAESLRAELDAIALQEEQLHHSLVQGAFRGDL